MSTPDSPLARNRPSTELERFRKNVAAVQNRIRSACARSARAEQTVHIIAVTKYTTLATCRALLELGFGELGESRVQQLGERGRVLGADTRSPWAADMRAPAAPAVPRWHLIGHLQRNKVRAALAASRVVHSLDSIRLAHALVDEAARLETSIDVFVEVNLAQEASKSGISPHDAPALAECASRLPSLCVRGLMTMAPLGSSPESARRTFAELRELLEFWRKSGVVGPDCRDLSMGMSRDFEVAIEEGATWTRVGSALFEGLSPEPPVEK